MATKNVKQKSTFPALGVVLIIVGALLFPALTLLPFLIHSSQRVFIATPIKDVAGNSVFLHCSGHDGFFGSLDKINQCVGWLEPSSQHDVELFGLLLLLVLAAATFLYTRRQDREFSQRFGVLNSLTAIVVALASVVAYYILHGFSQQAWGYFVANQLPNGIYVVNHPPALGYGLNPYYVVLFSALYLLVPLANLISWYRPMVDPRYVGGVKKRELFQ